MSESHQPESQPARHDPESELVSYLQGRSAPCPRCGYDLRDIQTARCPECGEPLVLKVGSPRTRFGWLLVAIAPGCFSGVAAVFVLLPLYMNTGRVGVPFPWPILGADLFGFTSAATVALMYRRRHQILASPTRRQGLFAATVWLVHVLALGLLILWVWMWQ